jgi:hypothetical protein
MFIEWSEDVSVLIVLEPILSQIAGGTERFGPISGRPDS